MVDRFCKNKLFAGLKNYLSGMAICFVMTGTLVACGSNDNPNNRPNNYVEEIGVTKQENKEMSEKQEEGGDVLSLFINEVEVPVNWEENESVETLNELTKEAPIVIELSMYGGFEQVGSIGQSLPSNDRQMTTKAGDIVLYSGNQLVVFYGSNSWAYTKLGHIEGKSKDELSEMLGSGDVTITLK